MELRKRAYRHHIQVAGLAPAVQEDTTPWKLRATPTRKFLCCELEAFNCYHDALSGEHGGAGQADRYDFFSVTGSA